MEIKLFVTNQDQAIELLGSEKQKDLHKKAWHTIFNCQRLHTDKILETIDVDRYEYQFVSRDKNKFKYKLVYKGV